MKEYKKLIIPNDSSWDRKSYNPYSWFKSWVYNKFHYSDFEFYMNKFLFTPIHNIIEGVTNFYFWTKVIFKDRNWDDFYIFEILKHKLYLQRKYLIYHNRHTRIDQDNRDMTLCLNLIERIQEDFYQMEYMDYQENESKFIPTDKKLDGKELFEWKSDIKKENFDNYFKKYPNSYRIIMNNEKYRKYYNNWGKQVQAMALARYQQEKCQSLLFKILNERINNFWD